MPMQLMVMKAFCVKSQNSAQDAVSLARNALKRYQAQRYRDPSSIGVTPWKKIAPDEHTAVFNFPGSDIVIAERWSSTLSSSLDEMEKTALELDRELDGILHETHQHAAPLWASYWLVVEDKHISEHQEDIRKWLRDSIRPDDAEAIINRTLDVSMTWLRYVAVKNDNLADYIRSMRIAQYYYAEFDQINSKLFHLIGKLSQRRVPKMDETAVLRRTLDMKRLQLREDLRILPRHIKKTIEGILECWEFDQLDRSVNQLQDICSTLLADHWDRKAGASRVASEVILVAIGLFGFLNLMIAWAIFSRQVATNPMLLLNEPALPSTARVIASMPIDSLVMLSIGLGLAILAIYIVFRRGYR